MNECKEYIAEIYQDKRIDKLIRSIKPAHLQEELRQEVALVLLEYDCNKLLPIIHEGKLINFVCRIIWNMGTLPNGNFYKTFKKINTNEILEYSRTNEGEEIPYEFIESALSILEIKLSLDPNEAHESIIFQKYVELQSCTKVAEYFGIPRLHVFTVVNNVKKELRKNIRK